MMACSSSRITARADESIFCPVLPVSSRYSDSGVVIRICGGFRIICCRSRCVVSPVRIPVTTSAAAPIPSSGFFRFSRISAASDFSGDTYTSCSSRFSSPFWQQRFIWSKNTRNADSVFPVPVGADTSTCSPAEINGQASCCTGVGSPSDSRNHLAVPSSKSVNTSSITHPILSGHTGRAVPCMASSL